MILLAVLPRPPGPAKPKQSLVSTMVANPTPLNAFLVGVIVFAPGVTFLAALQVIATARAGVSLNALALIIVVVITCCWSGSRSCSTSPCRESPRVFYGWLRAHGKVILTVVLIAAALIMVGNGIYGLTVAR